METGNNLIVLAWAGGRIGTPVLLGNWAIVYVGNFVGGHRIATDKPGLEFGPAVMLGILCNVLGCLAVWLARRDWRTHGRDATTLGSGPLSHGRPTWDDRSVARRVERRATP